MVKKMRTILSVAHHNLRMLEQNLVDGLQKKYPHLDPEATKATIIPDVEKSPETKKPVPESHDESRDMFEEYANEEDANEENNHKENVNEGVVNEGDINDEDVNGEDVNEGDINYEDVNEGDSEAADLNTSLNDANANTKAREEVLKSSSDDFDVAAGSHRAQEETPRKKLKTKKELNELRQRKPSYGDDEDSSEEDEESFNNSSESHSKKVLKKLKRKALQVDLESNEQLNKKVRIDIRKMKSEVREDLDQFDQVC